MQLLAGKNALIVGIANDRSLAWAIAQALHRHGATLACTYAAENLSRRVHPLAASLGVETVLPCDVTRDQDITTVFETLAAQWGRIDVLIHATAFAQRDELKGAFLDTSRAGFQLALDVSTYALIALTRAAAPLMSAGSSVLTLTYYGAEKAIPHYNVMGVAKAALEASVRALALDLGPAGVRVNAISAGPVRTLSAAGITGFRTMMHHHAERAPLQRNVTSAEVADTAVYLSSDLSTGVTGEVVHVDGGYNIVGM